MSDPRPPESGTDPAGPSAEDPLPSERADLSAPSDVTEDVAGPPGVSEDALPPGVSEGVEPATPAIDLSEPEPEPAAVPPAEPVDEGATPPLAPPAAPPSPTDAPDAAGGQGVAKPKSDAWKLALVVVIFVAVVVVAYILGKGGGGGDSQPGDVASSSTTVNTTPVDTSDWATYDDDVSGFSLKHPKDWVITGEPQGQNRLLISAGQQNFLLVTARTIDPASVESDIAQAMAEQQVITGPQKLQLDGQPAVLYIYNTPVTEDNRVEGVIIHYFIVRGSKMYSMIFQARPKEELNRLARTYNAVTNSFKSTSDVPAPDPIPTTAP